MGINSFPHLISSILHSQISIYQLICFLVCNLWFAANRQFLQWRCLTQLSVSVEFGKVAKWQSGQRLYQLNFYYQRSSFFKTFGGRRITAMGTGSDLYRSFGALSVASSGAVVLTGLLFPKVMISPKRLFPHILFFISVCDMIGK